jgi:hypothetical protein
MQMLHALPFYWHDIFHEYGDANNAMDKGKMDGFSQDRRAAAGQGRCAARAVAGRRCGYSTAATRHAGHVRWSASGAMSRVNDTR